MSAGETEEGAGRLDAALRAGERRALAQAITLLESTRADHAAEGQALLERLVPSTGGAVRVGITGPPGVGKSTFIEALGLHLVEAGRRIAVLAVDPSRERLARRPEAFIRPSPSGGSLGGVAQRTREAAMLCEAAGYDVVVVETVGIGQSEIAVAGMVDFFLILLQPGSGDELQGIKRGAVELADGLVVNKADGEWREAAERIQGQYAQALQLLRPLASGWRPRVLCASGRTGEGIGEVWSMLEEQRAALEASGEAQARRRAQARAWMWSLVEEGLQREFRDHPGLAGQAEALEAQVEALETTPGRAAQALLEAFRGR
jgi:LAO/AO transport system kinase